MPAAFGTPSPTPRTVSEHVRERQDGDDARSKWALTCVCAVLRASGAFPSEVTNAQVAAAGMHLKGEGGVANHSRAVGLYERAAQQGSLQALNGLGYAFFFGNHLPQVPAPSRPHSDGCDALSRGVSACFRRTWTRRSGTSTRPPPWPSTATVSTTPVGRPRR